ncbi:MAG: hypothetical protein E4H03_02370 [Myxococcales bacterium]|nr:MAG: hypothetical protein E4H03_02370 [Myxococcales bacterium]
MYVAPTGFDGATNNRAEWNYDWHVDLRGTGTTLKDYKLTLTQTFAPKLGGAAGPLDLTVPVPPFLPTTDDIELYQQSWNPTFFNDTFDVNAQGTYNIKLTLAPRDGGPPLIARIKVIVTDE